jgi:hypothetical protein
MHINIIFIFIFPNLCDSVLRKNVVWPRNVYLPSVLKSLFFICEVRNMTCNINTGEHFVQILFGQVDSGGEGLLQLSGTVRYRLHTVFWELNH